MQILEQIQVPYSFAKRHGVLFRYDGIKFLLLDVKIQKKLHCRKQIDEFLGKTCTPLRTEQELIVY